MEDRLRVGVITSAHGVHGEANVFPTTDDALRFKKLKKVYIDTKKEQIKAEIEGVKFFKNMVILKFNGIDDRNLIEKYKSCDLLIDREDAVPLGEDEYFICDLIGFDVVSDTDEHLGTLTDILTTAANDVYMVNDENGREILIPSTKDCILNIDTDKKIICVHLLKGMI